MTQFPRNGHARTYPVPLRPSDCEPGLPTPTDESLRCHPCSLRTTCGTKPRPSARISPPGCGSATDHGRMTRRSIRNQATRHRRRRRGTTPHGQSLPSGREHRVGPAPTPRPFSRSRVTLETATTTVQTGRPGMSTSVVACLGRRRTRRPSSSKWTSIHRRLDARDVGGVTERWRVLLVGAHTIAGPVWCENTGGHQHTDQLARKSALSVSAAARSHASTDVAYTFFTDLTRKYGQKSCARGITERRIDDATLSECSRSRSRFEVAACRRAPYAVAIVLSVPILLVVPNSCTIWGCPHFR